MHRARESPQAALLEVTFLIVSATCTTVNLAKQRRDDLMSLERS